MLCVENLFLNVDCSSINCSSLLMCYFSLRRSKPHYFPDNTPSFLCGCGCVFTSIEQQHRYIQSYIQTVITYMTNTGCR